jgi:hypothetical protein
MVGDRSRAAVSGRQEGAEAPGHPSTNVRYDLLNNDAMLLWLDQRCRSHTHHYTHRTHTRAHRYKIVMVGPGGGGRNAFVQYFASGHFLTAVPRPGMVD